MRYLIMGQGASWRVGTRLAPQEHCNRLTSVMKLRKANRVDVLHAYADETGNTGFNLFDASQPSFWTGTIVSTYDLHAEARTFVDELCRFSGVKELHGSSLGLEGIEQIAPRLQTFLGSHECEYVFTMLDKCHLAATKLADTLLDSYHNKGVSHLHYVSPLRAFLELSLIPLITYGDRVTFWNAYEKLDHGQFKKVLERLQARVVEKVRDARARDLLSDALSWAIRYPDAVLVVGRDDLDSPNLVTFMSLIDELRDFANEKNAFQIKLIHDEQSQFGKSIEWTFEMMKNLRWKQKRSLFLETFTREKNSAYKSPIDVSPSTNSPGLQLLDLALWITKRYVERRVPPSCPNTVCLAREISQHARIVRITLKSYQERTRKAFDSIMKADFSAEHARQGEMIMQRNELARLKRMAEKPD
ncbi:hypothetical protein DNFV4_03792 [Nitrospira tepida]|uniref:DUF3800 domain-containing protein n=1 Tax=Nitrospira tepida TaxID=2973512 RepID=A0AA86N2B4_9BACT|nr:DUF3800 domain-containing protein [Nitrospira tepida]CAI4033356.1 hypothetical protein DNFV4_03792 [Nitrospira tepida]